jgi:outer membrane protein TolC
MKHEGRKLYRDSGDVARPVLRLAAVCAALLGSSLPLAAQVPASGGGRPLSLEDALRMAENASEQVRIARAGVLRSSGELRRARSEYFPQLSASLGYTRTLDSEFSAFSGSGTDTTTTAGESCGSFTPNPALPLAQRVDSLEAALSCQSNADPFSAFRNLPFGRENQWRLDLSLTQTVFSGGRVQAQSRIADAGRRVAQLELTSQRAQLMLNVAQAYYDAALAATLFTIAEATLGQAETTLSQVQLARQVGNQPEFELLRAQVTRDTQRPLVIQRRADRDLALLRLKQALNLPAEAAVELTTLLDDAEPAALVRVVTQLLGVELDTAAAARIAVRSAQEAVRVQEGLSTIARAQRLPSLSVNMQYGRVGYPTNVSPLDVPFRTNWTVGASIQLPLFTGGRLSGEGMIAQANLDEARARLDLTRELAALDTRDAAERLAAAQASWEASSGTITQASRAYDIAEVRYQEGISTQLELNDSRILLQQAQANRAQAARDLQVARLRVALLPWLPMGASVSSTQTPSFFQTTPAQQQTTTPAGVTTQQAGATTTPIRAQATQVRN